MPNPDFGLTVIQEIWAQFGSIYLYDFSTNSLDSDPLREELSIACVPRATYFEQLMVICNGVDNVVYWDGEELKDISEFLLENQVNTFIRIDDNNFSFISFGIFDASNYFIGNLIRLRINGVYSNFEIQDISFDELDLVTITTDEELPDFVENQVVLFYQVKPPAFSYIYAAKDRIWALGPGPVSLEYRDTQEQLRVYYPYAPNVVDGPGWFNENTKKVPFIDMSDKYDKQDNFEAICQVNGLMVFIGRKHTQVWVGDTPGQGGNFTWNSNLPAGILHGDLLVELDNDVYFVSQTGIKSFSTLNIARQLSATPDNAVDTIVKNFNSQATSSNANYRICRSFKYNEGQIAGFKIANNKIIASLFSTTLYSWVFLSGDFSLSSCFMDIDKQFYMFIGNKIFKYSDGNDGTKKLYGDQGGEGLIPIVWVPGLLKFKGRKGYANKRYELILDYPSSFTINKKNSIEISVFGDVPINFYLNDKCTFEQRGDVLGQEPLSLHPSPSTSIGFRPRNEYEIVNKRLKFSASSFWLSISGYVMNGPITFRRIRLFGVGERNA
ncbi:MAG: hypothetical protein K0R49_1575 [Burkholderiales bacterium]|nr:hypothetical protein [Burkholderiales bacterium]